MAVVDSPSPTSSGLSDWLLELVIGVTVVVLAVGVWAFTHYSDQTAQDKPTPVWLGVAKVMAQMSDGRMVSIKVNLRLDDEDAVDQLEPHIPAFKALIQETGTQLSREKLQGREGMKHFAKAIVGTLNGYLDERNEPARIKSLAFEELMLMP